MGEKDRQLKKYLEDPKKLADLANGILFQGRQLIHPEHLEYARMRKSIRLEKRGPGESTEGVFCRRKQEDGAVFVERERDDIRRHKSPDMDCYIACEGQSSMDGAMALREWTYDAVEYTGQLEAKENPGRGEDGLTHPLIPVLNIVLYFGESRWKSKHSLQEMMQIKGELKRYTHLLPDYHIHLADVREQDPMLFCTEWRDVFAIMGKSRKKEELRSYIQENTQTLDKLTPQTQQFLLALLDCHSYTPEQIEKEGITVCRAWDEAMQDYKEEGREEGREEGIIGVIEILQGYGAPKEKIIQEIQERFCLPYKTAEEKYIRHTLSM